MATPSRSHELLPHELLPMCVGDRRAPARGGRAAHLLVLVVVLALTVLALRTASTASPGGADTDARALDDALRSLSEATDALPEAAFLRVGGDLRALASSTGETLFKIRQLPAPLPDAGIAHELHYLEDLVLATVAELDAAGRPMPDGPAEHWAGRIDRLTSAGTASLQQVDTALDGWIEHGRRAIVTVEERPDALIVTSISRLVHDGVRAAGTALFLIGLLVLGYQLLTVGDGGSGLLGLVRRAPFMSSTGVAGVALFMAGSFVLGTDPLALVELSAHRQAHAREHACQVLAVESRQLRHAQTLGSAHLVSRVEERMAGATQACLSLDGRMAAEEVVGALVARAERPAGGLDEPDAAAPTEAAPGAGTERELPRARAPQDAENGTRPATSTDLIASPPEDRGEPDGGEPDLTPLPPEPAPRTFVTTTSLNFRAGPSAEAARLGTLDQGAPVRLVGEEGRWSMVRLEDGRGVYVASAFLRPAD